MNILVTINRGYLECLKVLVKSIKRTNESSRFVMYVVHRDLLDSDIEEIRNLENINFKFKFIKIDEDMVSNLPVYVKRYPLEIYFRLFASKYLPKDVDKILYLDTDIVVINDLKSIYDINFEDNYFIATSNVDCFILRFNQIRLGMRFNMPYINSGVMMINVSSLRGIDIYDDIRNFVKKKRYMLMLPDQDIISGLYGDKVKVIDNIRFNLGDRGLSLYNMRNLSKIDLDWVRENVIIIHYYGKNKPWRENYKGILNCFYNEVIEDSVLLK